MLGLEPRSLDFEKWKLFCQGQRDSHGNFRRDHDRWVVLGLGRLRLFLAKKKKKKREGSGVSLGRLEGGGLSPSGVQQLVRAVSWDPASTGRCVARTGLSPSARRGRQGLQTEKGALPGHQICRRLHPGLPSLHSHQILLFISCSVRGICYSSLNGRGQWGGLFQVSSSEQSPP